MQAWGMSPWEGRKEPSRLTGTTAFLPAHPLSGQLGTARLCLPPQPHGSSSAGILLSAGLESWEQLLGWEIPLYPELLFNKDFRQLQCNKPSLLPGGGAGGGAFGVQADPPTPPQISHLLLAKGPLPTCWELSGRNPLPRLLCKSPWGLPCAWPPALCCGSRLFQRTLY